MSHKVCVCVCVCAHTHTAYPVHRQCLMNVEKQLDCFGVYPQMIPLALFWTLNMDLAPYIIHEVDRPISPVHLLFYGLSRHLWVELHTRLATTHTRPAEVRRLSCRQHTAGFQLAQCTQWLRPLTDEYDTLPLANCIRRTGSERERERERDCVGIVARCRDSGEISWFTYRVGQRKVHNYEFQSLQLCYL